jgi:ubiquinone/menaquinone biosynthesis C-methylase UbiE
MTMCEDRFTPYRERVLASAKGRVLEVGIGSGENLRRYGAQVSEVVGLEPSAKLARMARRAASDAPVAANVIEASAEAMPLDDRSFDSVVMTWTLCSITDPTLGQG